MKSCTQNNYTAYSLFIPMFINVIAKIVFELYPKPLPSGLYC
jgi:hypothetical protein